MREKPRGYSEFVCGGAGVFGGAAACDLPACFEADPDPAGSDGFGVLSIGKIGKSEQQQKYYEESVAQSREDYYAGRGEAPGEFFGAGARALGLSGQTDMAQLQRLFAGQHPGTGEQLRSMKGNVQVHGFDLTFSAPKSISMAYALGDSDLQANLVTAHEWAAEGAIAYLERESARVVRGHKATRAERAEGIADTLTTHRATGFVGIRYRHRVNRLQDPQLHTHYVIGNWAMGPDARCTAFAAEHIYEHAKAGGAVYQLLLRYKVRELEPWVEWGAVENGMAELSAELMDPEMLRAFSMRTQDLEEFMVNPYKFIRNPVRAREAELAMAGMPPRARRQYATLRTRKSKIEGTIEDREWSQNIADRSAEFDFTADTLRAYREGPAAEPAPAFDVSGVQARAFGPNGVTANQNTFERKDVVIEIANSAPQGVGAWLSDIDAVVAQVMTSDQVVHVRTDRLREKLTTVELLGWEQEQVRAAVEGLDCGRAVVDVDTIEQGLEQFFANHPDISRDKFSQQESVLRAVGTDGHAISSIEALAGSGKTTTAGAMREVFEAGGYRAFAAGPTGRAVRELARVGFERPRTLSAWEVKFEIMGAREAIRQAFGDPSKAVLLIDETGMADTRLLSRITTAMADAGVKVVLIGDSYQLTSVRAGGMHAALSQQLGAYELTTVRRQNLIAEIDALEQLRIGNATAYIRYKRGVERDGMWFTRGDEDFAGRSDLEVFTGEEAEEAGMAQAVADYLEMRERGAAEQQPLLGGQAAGHAHGLRDIALITKNNDRRALLNRMIRDELTARGALTGHMPMGSFQREKLEWAVGDRVIARRNHKGYDLDNGTLGTITALDETGMTLADDNGNERRFDAGSIEDLRYVSEHLEHAYALTAHGTQGATLRWAGVVGMPGEFSREWAYTALSRAQQPTKIYLVSGHTTGEQARKDYATVPDAETDHEKVLGRLAGRMEKRDLDQVALLQRARDGQLGIGGVADDLNADSEAEFLADVERYRDGKYRLAGESFTRMRAGDPVGGEKLRHHIDLLAYRNTVEHANHSDRMQDALQAAGDWQRLGNTIEGIFADAGESELTPEQRQSIETLIGVRDEILTEYPDPQAVLNIEAQRVATLAQLDRELRVTRAAAIAEHIAAKPEWLTVLGTHPSGKKLREVWGEVVEDLAGRYIDARAAIEMEHSEGARAERAAEPVVSNEQPGVVALARAEADRAYNAYLADPGNGELMLEAIAKTGAADRAELAAAPQWLAATLGERPLDPALAEQWDTIGTKLLGVRRANHVMSEIDNGYAHADITLRRSIGRFRIQAGLDVGPGVDTGYGLGD